MIPSERSEAFWIWKENKLHEALMVCSSRFTAARAKKIMKRSIDFAWSRKKEANEARVNKPETCVKTRAIWGYLSSCSNTLLQCKEIWTSYLGNRSNTVEEYIQKPKTVLQLCMSYFKTPNVKKNIMHGLEKDIKGAWNPWQLMQTLTYSSNFSKNVTYEVFQSNTNNGCRIH